MIIDETVDLLLVFHSLLKIPVAELSSVENQKPRTKLVPLVALRCVAIIARCVSSCVVVVVVASSEELPF